LFSPELIAVFKLDAVELELAETPPETLLEPLTIELTIIAFKLIPGIAF
jgi:hypothetical protein